MSLSLIGAAIVGLTLGVLGSGGSILTVPILTLGVGLNEKVAITSSLAIVAAITATTSIPWARRAHVDARLVALFAGPGMIGSALGAEISGFVPGRVQMAAFAVLLLVAAALMIRPLPAESNSPAHSGPWLVLDGLLLGLVTGFVGVGGGFLIVPALVLLAGVPITRAIGSSLVIISINAGAGFFRSVAVLEGLGLTVDWTIIGQFIVCGIGGSLAGAWIAPRIPQSGLRKAFAGLLLGLGALTAVSSWG